MREKELNIYEVAYVILSCLPRIGLLFGDECAVKIGELLLNALNDRFGIGGEE